MRIYLFNPDHDMALASFSPYYKAPSEIIRMKEDLAPLPVWYADKGDKVKVGSEIVADDFMNQCQPDGLAAWGTLTVEWCASQLSPWGWDPAVVHMVSGVEDACIGLPDMASLQQIKILSGRQCCVNILRSFKDFPMTCGQSVVCESLEMVEDFMNRNNEVVLKAPWSGSGRGLVRTSKEKWTPNLKGWVSRIIRTQDAVMAEPLYNKVVDFAMEFKMEDKLSFVGYSLFETDEHGNYKQNILASDQFIEDFLGRFVSRDSLEQVKETLLESLSQLLGNQYVGYLGVDMMICSENDCFLIHPCVEINLRMNMGVVSRLLFDRYVSSESRGNYVVTHFTHDGEALRQDQSFREKFPSKVIGGKMVEGYFPLTPVNVSTRYQCYALIEKNQ